jgi:hypothetical protein
LINEAGYGRWSAPRIAMAAAVLTAALSACGSDPYSYNWSDVPDTVRIYSMDRSELNLPDAFSFYDGFLYAVEQPTSTGRWDVALDTEGGELVLLPPGVFGIGSRARIAPLPAIAYGDLTQAPGEGEVWIENEAVPVAMGTTYAIRTGSRIGSYGSSCSYYAKMEPVEIDVAGGKLVFRYTTNPVCNSRDLVPPN